MRLRQMFKEVRASRGWSLREMAEKTGIEYSALCRFERGKPLHEGQWTQLVRWFFPDGTDEVKTTPVAEPEVKP